MLGKATNYGSNIGGTYVPFINQDGYTTCYNHKGEKQEYSRNKDGDKLIAGKHLI